jgi:hypothetical protein
MNVAQQVRIWFGVGVGILLTIATFGMVGSLTSVLYRRYQLLRLVRVRTRVPGG